MKAITTNADAQLDQVIKQVIKSWEAQNKNVTDFFNKYDDSYYINEVAPGRNRALYLLGHLVGMNDMLLPMLGIGDKLFPELEALFVTSPDKAVTDLPSIATLKANWQTLIQTLTTAFEKMEASAWLERHTRVSEEDFAIDPLRNKLNVLIGRVNHQSYHMGQLALLNRK